MREKYYNNEKIKEAIVEYLQKRIEYDGFQPVNLTAEFIFKEINGKYPATTKDEIEDALDDLSDDSKWLIKRDFRQTIYYPPANSKQVEASLGSYIKFDLGLGLIVTFFSFLIVYSFGLLTNLQESEKQLILFYIGGYAVISFFVTKTIQWSDNQIQIHYPNIRGIYKSLAVRTIALPAILFVILYAIFISYTRANFEFIPFITAVGTGVAVGVAVYRFVVKPDFEEKQKYI